MSEVDLGALAEADKDRIQSKVPTPMQEVNLALREAGFGLFHIQLLATTFVAFIASVLVSNTTSYLLPSAECDLHMNLVQKGLLNAVPYLGMIFSSVVAGFLTDAFGRKMFIVWGLGVNFLINIVSGSSQTYEVLVTAKFFEGLVLACYFTATITLTSEFCHEGIRDRILIFQSSYASVAQILLAVMSWGILPNDWGVKLFDGMFVLHTWNIYLYLMSLWSLVGCVMYLFIPESPKYLVTQKKYDEARNILIKVYRINTRKSVDTFVYKDLWKIKADGKGNGDFGPEKTQKETFAHHITIALHNIKPLFQGQLLLFQALICTMNCVIMAVYNTFRLWYPQVSTIVEHNSFDMADGTTQDLCMILDSYTQTVGQQTSNATKECITHKSGAETYINSIIIGCVCCIPHFVSGILVARVGKKAIQLVAALIAIASTVGLMFADSKAAVVSLFALAIAITQSTMSLNQVCTLEYLPTNMRSLGISLMMVTGRLGTLAGNILFPVMLKMGCSIPFYGLSGMILCVVVMTIFLPTKKKT